MKESLDWPSHIVEMGEICTSRLARLILKEKNKPYQMAMQLLDTPISITERFKAKAVAHLSHKQKTCSFTLSSKISTRTLLHF